MNRRELLEWDRQATARWLSGFDVSATPLVGVEASGETFWIKNFPLPDQFQPDRIDLALVVKSYPTDPPKGIYLLSEASHRKVITKIQSRFHIFQDMGFHGAPSIQGFEWICFGYLHGWRFDARDPNKGDNIQKMFANFWRLLAS